MKLNINRALNSKKTRAKVEWDFTHTFKQIGLNERSAIEMTRTVINNLLQASSL